MGWASRAATLSRMLCFVVYRVPLLAACLCLLAQAAQAQSTPGARTSSSSTPTTSATATSPVTARRPSRRRTSTGSRAKACGSPMPTAAAATCTPSRYSLLTGEYAWRQKGTGVLPGDAGAHHPSRPDDAAGDLPARRLPHRRRRQVASRPRRRRRPRLERRRSRRARARSASTSRSSWPPPATACRRVYVENGRVVGLDPADPIVVRYDAPVGDWPTGAREPRDAEACSPATATTRRSSTASAASAT